LLYKKVLKIPVYKWLQVVSQTDWLRKGPRYSSRPKILLFTTTKHSLRRPTAAGKYFRM